MSKSFYYDNAESLEKIRQDMAFLDSVKDPLKNPYTLAAKEEAPKEEDVLTKGEREAYLIGNYAKGGYVPTYDGYLAFETWKKQNEPSAWGTIWEAGKHAVSTVANGIYDTVTSGDILNPLTVGGTVVESGGRGTRYFVNMLDQIKYDPTNPIHRSLFSQGTPEERYADFQKGLEFQRETGEIENTGYWVPKKEWDVEGWKIRTFNESGVAAGEMVLDPSIIMPNLKIGSMLSRTALGSAISKSAARVAVKGANLAERAAMKIEGGAGKVAGTAMGIFEWPAHKTGEFLGIETLTTSNGKVIAKDSIIRGSGVALGVGAYLAQIPFAAPVAGVWLGAKVTEITGKTIAEALGHAKVPSYLTIADRLAYQSTDPAVRAIGGIAMRTNGFTDWATQGVKSTFHGSMYGGAFGFALGGEEGFYSGVGTGIGLAGSFHMLGGAYGIVGNRKERQIANAQKHFAYVAEGFDEAKRYGVNKLLQNIEEVYGQEKMFRTMANIAAAERLNKNGKNLILTTEQIQSILGDSPDWAEYQKLMKDPQFGGYTTRRGSNGEVVTIINADYAAHSAVSGELFHSALLQRYGQGMKEHIVKSLLGTADSDGFLYKLAPETRIKMLEDFKRAYLELDDTSGGGAQRSMLKSFDEAIEQVKRGEKPETLYPIFEEYAEAYFNRWVEDKPIDYLLRGSNPFEAVFDGAKKMVRGLIDRDIEQIGGRIQFKSGEPEGFFLDGKGKRVVVPEMDKVMRLLVREMKKDPDALEGFPIRDNVNQHHVMLKDAEYLFTRNESGKLVRKNEEQMEAEWSKGITGLMNAHAKLKPEDKGLRFTQRVLSAEVEDVEGAFAPKSKAAQIEAEAKRLEKITKQRQAKLLREAARAAKLSDKEQRKLAREQESNLDAEVENLREQSEFEGVVEYKIEGYMTDAEINLFTEHLPKAVVQRMAAFNRVIHTKGSDGNNALRFDYESETSQNFSYTKEGSPTSAGNEKNSGRVKTRDVVPYEMILKFERKRLTKTLRAKYGLDDPDAKYAAIKPVLLVNGIDMKALDRRVRYAYNHMRRQNATSSISSATVKMYYESEEEIHHDIKRLLGNYSLGDIAMAGADFFGGGSEGRAKRDIINGIIGARPVRFSPDKMQKKGYHYPLDIQRPMTGPKSRYEGGPLNEAFMAFTSFRVDRMLDRPKHLHGEGFYYDHEYAHPMNKGNFQPRSKALRDHVGRPLSYSERQLQDETIFKSPSGEPFRVFASNKEGGVHYAWFDEARAIENHNQHTEGYISLRNNEVLDMLNDGKIDSVKDLNSDFMRRVADMGYKAVVARTNDGERVVAFTDFNNFKQTDVSAFDQLLGNFAPRSRSIAELTRERLGLTGATPATPDAGKPMTLAERTRARLGVTQSPVEVLAERTFGVPKAEPIKIDVATDIVVGTPERQMSPEQTAKVQKSLAVRKGLLAERGLHGEIRTEILSNRRKFAEAMAKTKEFKGWSATEVFDSMYTSIWGENATISITKGGKVSLGVIQSLSPSEYMAYRSNGVLPSDIKQRTIADIDMALMENWKRRHLLQQSLAQTKANVKIAFDERRKQEAKYSNELDTIRNELIQMLASYKMFDVADDVLGAEIGKKREGQTYRKEVTPEVGGWTPARKIDAQNSPDTFTKSKDRVFSYKTLKALYPLLGRTDPITAMDVLSLATPEMKNIRKEISTGALKHVIEEFNQYNLVQHRNWLTEKQNSLKQYAKEKEKLDNDIKNAESTSKKYDTYEARARSNELASKIREVEKSKDPIIEEWNMQGYKEEMVHDLLQMEPEQRKARIQKLEKTGIQIEKGNQGSLVSEEQFAELRDRTKKVYTNIRLSDPNAPQTENVQYGFSAETPVHNVGEYYVAQLGGGKIAIYKKPQYDKDATLRGNAVGYFNTLKEAQLRIKEIRNNYANVSFNKKTSQWVVNIRDNGSGTKGFGPVQDEIDSSVQKQKAEEYAKQITEDNYPELKGEIVEPSTDKQTAIEWPEAEQLLIKSGILPPEKMTKEYGRIVEVNDGEKRVLGGVSENYKDAMDEAYRVLQQSMKKDKTITPLQRFAVMMQSVARHYKKNPAFREKMKQLESLFKETEQLTDFNLKRAYKKMLDYGFVSMNWAGNEKKVVLDATGHYVERVSPPKKEIAMDFNKLRMPKGWAMKQERVVLTSTDGVKVSNNEMAKALRDMRKRFGEALADQTDDEIIELAKTAGKGMLLEEKGLDKQTDMYLTGEARTIRRWAAFEERKDNTYEETNSRIVYVEKKPKYILAKGVKSEKMMVIPVSETTFDKNKNTYYWSRDRQLNEKTKARSYSNIESWLGEEGAQFKSVRDLTLGDTSDVYGAYKPNGWHIDGKYFKTQDEAKRLAVIDAENNHAYEAVYKTAKRLDKDAYTTVLQMIQNSTGITYQNAIKEAIGFKGTQKKWIDNPDYNPNKPWSLQLNPRKIQVKEDFTGATVAPEFKKLAIYRAGNLLLVTSDNRKDVLTRLTAEAKVSVKGGRTKNIEGIAREAIGQYNSNKKVLGDLYRVVKDENGQMAGIDWITHYDNPRQVSEMITKMDDQSYVDLDTTIDFQRRLTKEIKPVLAKAFKDEKKKIFTVLTENPKKIREIRSRLIAIEEAHEKAIEDTGIIIKKGLKPSPKKDFINRNIDRLNRQTNELTDTIERKLHYIFTMGFHSRPEVAERLIGEGKYFENKTSVELYYEEILEDRKQQRFIRDDDGNVFTAYPELDALATKKKLEDSLGEIEKSWSDMMPKNRATALLEDVLNGTYDEEHELLTKQIDFLKRQLSMAAGGTEKVKAGLTGAMIGKKGGAGRWIGPKEQAAEEAKLKRIEANIPKKAEEVALGTVEKLLEGTQGLTEKKVERFPSYLAPEGESFVSGRDYLERFQRLVGDIAEAHKKFGDPASLDKLDLQKILDTDVDLLPTKEVDAHVARQESLDAMKDNIRNIEEYFDRSTQPQEGKDFKSAVDVWGLAEGQWMTEISENRINAAVRAALEGRQDHVILANRANQKIKTHYEGIIKARMAIIDANFAKLSPELKPIYIKYLERVRDGLAVERAAELERVQSEIATINETAIEYSLTPDNPKFAQLMASWQELGMKGDPMTSYSMKDESVRKMFPFLFSEFYPSRQDIATSSSYTKWESRATDEAVASDTTRVGTRQGMNVGGFTTTNPIVAEVIRNEQTRNKFLGMRGLREIDLFAAALAKKASVETQVNTGGKDAVVQIDAEGYALIERYFPELTEGKEGPDGKPVWKINFKINKEAGYEDSFTTAGYAKRVREEKKVGEIALQGGLIDKAFNYFLDEVTMNQSHIEHAIARLSGKERLAELTAPENLAPNGKIDIRKLNVEELDFAFHVLGKAKITNDKAHMSVIELTSNPLYAKSMILAFSRGKDGNLQSIFGDDPQKSATFLAMNLGDKKKFVDEIVRQIEFSKDKIESEKAKENKETLEGSIATAWKVKELEKISKEQLDAAKHLLLELAKTDSAVKAYKGKMEQFWSSRPQARTNILSIDDSLKLLSPNMEYGKAIIGADGKTVDVPVANPNDALFRTANGMFHAFKQGGSYKLFFAGYKSADGNVSIAPSHIMTAPDLQRLQVGIRMFHDDVKRVEVMSKAAPDSIELKGAEVASFSGSFFETHGGSISPDLLKALQVNLAQIGNYPDTTWLVTPESGNKRQIVIYPNTTTWDKLHNSGEYIKKDGSWYKDPAVRNAQERLDRARLELESQQVADVTTAEPKPSEIISETANVSKHDQPDAKDTRAEGIDNKVVMQVIEEGDIYNGTSVEPAMQDWTALKNKDGWVILREQSREAKGWRTKFKTFFPSGVLAGIDENEEDAVSRMFP